MVLRKYESNEVNKWGGTRSKEIFGGKRHILRKACYLYVVTQGQRNINNGRRTQHIDAVEERRFQKKLRTRVSDKFVRK